MAKYLSVLEQANTRRFLGDCQRIWDQMKGLNVFDPSQNRKGPISQSEVTGGQKPDGTPQAASGTPSETVLCPPSVASAKAAEQGRSDPYDSFKETRTVFWGQMLNSDDYRDIRLSYEQGGITIAQAWQKTAEKFKSMDCNEGFRPVKGSDWPTAETAEDHSVFDKDAPTEEEVAAAEETLERLENEEIDV